MVHAPDVETTTLRELILPALESSARKLYAAQTPAEVYEAAREAIDSDVGADAAALWQRDTDSQLFVRAGWELSEELLRTRLGKMDCGIGQAMMVVGAPLVVTDISEKPDPRTQFPVLRSFERELLLDMGMRTAVILPVAGHLDFALMLLFRDVTEVDPDQVAVLQRFAEHLVRALQAARDRATMSALVQIGSQLSASARIMSESMDEIARLTREMVSSGGVSIFLTHPDGRHLVLAGTTGLAHDDDQPGSYDEIAYTLTPDYSLTSGVYLKGSPLRWPDLEHPTSRQRLRARGYVWEARWSETETFEEGATKAVMMMPLIHSHTNNDGEEQTENVGVIRAAVRLKPQAYFAPEEQQALEQVADMLGKHIGAIRRAEMESMEAMHRMAHQFVSPLNALVWATARLKRKFGKGPADRVPLLEAVSDLALLAASYGRNFEMVSRIWSGRDDEFSRTPLRLARIVVRTVRNYQPIAQDRGIRIWMADDSLEGSVDQASNVAIDRNAFEHVLVNLIDNAVKYGARNSEITLTARNLENGKVALDIAGVSRIEIQEEDVERIFQKGHRTSQARKLLVAGTGTGLWLAREVMQRLGGDVSARPSVRGPGGHRVVFTVLMCSE